LLLAAAAVGFYREHLLLARAAESAAQRFSLSRRWPRNTAALRREPAGDLACDILGETVLRDVRTPFPENADEETRRTWLDDAGSRASEVSAARDLILEASAARPGWPYHWVLLGQLVLAQASLPGNAELADNPALWATPLRLSTKAAPGLDSGWTALAGGYLENWSRLDEALRAEVTPVLQRAFFDREFVLSHFSLAQSVLGSSRAMECLPERSTILMAAARACLRESDVGGAETLLNRRDIREKQERIADLRRIEELHRIGSIYRLRASCLAWVDDHPTEDMDDPVGRRQEAELLSLWPNDRAGTWGSDPRTDLVAFFLAGRESSIPGVVLDRAIESLSRVPPATQARVKLLAGRPAEAEELARGSQEDRSGWARFYIDLARFRLSEGRADGARNALDRLEPGERRGCDALLIRREVERALQNGEQVAGLNRELEGLGALPASSEPPPDGEARLPLCVDPESAAAHVARVEVDASEPTLLFYGWNGGRAGRFVASAGSSFAELPIDGRFGAQELALGPVGRRPGVRRVTALIAPGQLRAGAASESHGSAVER
jgi:hypothetical protein